MGDLLDGVRRVDPMAEGGLLACLTREVDLDDLMLALADWLRDDPYTEDDYCEDQPTRLSSSGWMGAGEAEVRWWRKTFCHCGEEHGWDLLPAEPHTRGAFLGVFT